MKDLVKERIVAYRERNRILAAMGYASYEAYRCSALWRGVRAKVLAVNPFCYVCNGNAAEVHHAKYRKIDLEGRCLNFLYPVCRGCHGKFEFRNDGAKLSPKRASHKMQLLRTLKRTPPFPSHVVEKGRKR